MQTPFAFRPPALTCLSNITRHMANKTPSYRWACSLIAAGFFSACSTPMSPAPVVERSVNAVSNTSVGGAAGGAVGAVRPPAATTNVTTSPRPAPPVVQAPPTVVIDGKTYTVKKSDTLYSIALENGLSYRDLALWNGISNPSYIQIDQVLRLTAPAVMVASPAGVSPIANTSANSGNAVTNGVAQSSPIVMPGERSVTINPAPAPASASGATSSGATTTSTTTAATSVSTPAAPAATNDVVWQWPVGKAKLSSSYVEGKTKGVDFSGNMGDPIVSAADGKVVYAGNALKGYGQMLIVKHSEVYLTAYAHNSRLLVKEDALVKRGQKIAEMGNSESDNGQIKLHFELRRSGKPVDPIKLMPAQ